MKVIFNITENKNKATFQQEVVKINTSFNQTQNIVKPKFQIGYYPLPVGLENYYTKNETDLLLENYYLKSETYSKTEIDNSLALKLEKGTYNGTAQDLKNDIETKQKKLSSFDESILIETDGNIEGNVSLFTEYFQQQVCELNFIPTQIIGVYKDGIKLLPEEFNISLPKTITIKTYSTEKIEIQYTHLKS